MKSGQITRVATRSCVVLGACFGLLTQIGLRVHAQEAKNQEAKNQEAKNQEAKSQESGPTSGTDAGLKIVEMSGKLEAVLGNRLKLKTDDGNEAIVLVANDSEFQYTGTAEPKFLVPGLFVRFTAAFDNSGMPQSAVRELEIFRPIKKRRMSRELMQSQTPGIYPVTEQDQAKQADKGDKGKSSQPPANVPPGAQLFHIVGQLRGLQADKMSVVAGGRPVIVPIDPNVEISVSSGDPFFCVQGDQVELTALQNPAGAIQAETIEVTGAQPLGKELETPAVRGRRGNSKLGEGKASPDQADTAKPKAR